MTQSKILETLNSLMPEIISTKSPEKCMLKFARSHNLCPAQLEKLAQVYNVTKTNVSLEKSANRGDSFNIIDVPSLISDYTSYDPERYMSSENKQTHKTVDKITKSASTQPANLHFDEYGNVIHERIPFIFGTQKEILLTPSSSTFDIMHKAASAESVMPKSRLEAHRMAYEALEGISDLNYAIKQSYEKFHEKVIFDNDKWSEICADMHDTFAEAAQPTLEKIAAYCKSQRTHLTTPAFEKKAFVRLITRDRHNVTDDFSTIKEASETLEDLTFIRNAMLKLAAMTDDEFNAIDVSKGLPTAVLEAFGEPTSLEDAFKKPVPTTTPPDVTLSGDSDPNSNGAPKVNVNGANSSTKAPATNTSGSTTTSKNTPPKTSINGGTGNGGGNGNNGGGNNGGKGKGKGKGKDKDKNDAPDPSMNVPYITGAFDPNKAVEDTVGAGKAFVDGLHNPLFKVRTNVTQPLETLQGLIDKYKPKEDSTQKAIDSAVGDAEMQTTLQRLILSDPVLMQEDPGKVSEIFNTIASISPTFAKDPVKMGPVLKESIQYDSVPLPILKDLASFEGAHNKAMLDSAKLNSEQYRY